MRGSVLVDGAGCLHRIGMGLELRDPRVISFLFWTHNSRATTTRSPLSETMPPKLWIPGGADKEMKYMTDRMRRSEALSLYREIIRTAKHFHWADDSGRPWNKQLRDNARREFEASREEKDLLVISRMIVTGRDCLQQVQNRFNDATQAAWKRIETDSSRQASRFDPSPKTPGKR
jgi:hypothetical protein